MKKPGTTRTMNRTHSMLAALAVLLALAGCASQPGQTGAALAPAPAPAPAAAAPVNAAQATTPVVQDSEWARAWWPKRHQEKLAQLAQQRAAGKPIELVFIGDSITHGWETGGLDVWNRNYAQYNPLNLGFSADRTEHVLWRLQHGEVEGIHPKVAVLMIGTNNTGQRKDDPAVTAAGIRADLDEIRSRLPDTKILLLAVFPRDANPDSVLRQMNEKVNATISGFADNRHIYYLNINQAFLDGQGVLSKAIMPDLLHPNATGYDKWASAMAPTLQRLMQQ
jgi:lysophospholipase L1-like esterase